MYCFYQILQTSLNQTGKPAGRHAIRQDSNRHDRKEGILEQKDESRRQTGKQTSVVTRKTDKQDGRLE